MRADISTTEGIEAVFLTTHNGGKAAKSVQGLGHELEFDTGHSPTDTRIVLKVPDPDGRVWSLQAPAKG